MEKCVFLGGTCNESKWRDQLIPKLKISYFNPVVPDWTPECQKEEIKQREKCEYLLYTITPRMVGVYSICEVTQDSIIRPEKTIFCYLSHDIDDDNNIIKFSDSQLRSLQQVARVVTENGALAFNNLADVIVYLNKGVDK